MTALLKWGDDAPLHGELGHILSTEKREIYLEASIRVPRERVMSEHRSSISEPKILHSNHQTSSRNRYSHHQWRFVSKHRELFGYIISTRHYPPYILCILRTVESNCRHGGVRVGVWTNRRCNGIFYTGLILITHSVALTISSTLKLEKSYLFYYFYSIIKKIQLLIKKWPSPIFYNISMLLFNQCRKAKMFCGRSQDLHD